MIDMTGMLHVHVGLSFMALALGFVAIREVFDSQSRIGTELFLVTGILATLTGFFLPFNKITPAVAVGYLSSVIFLLLLAARFVFRYKGIWRAIYAVCTVISVYFLVFVMVAQAFLKISSLKALAPTGSEPPFIIAQVIVLIIFISRGHFAVKSFRPN